MEPGQPAACGLLAQVPRLQVTQKLVRTRLCRCHIGLCTLTVRVSAPDLHTPTREYEAPKPVCSRNPVTSEPSSGSTNVKHVLDPDPMNAVCLMKSTSAALKGPPRTAPLTEPAATLTAHYNWKHSRRIT